MPGLATGLGGVAVLIFRRPNALTLDAVLGFTAGVMLAATAFSLLVPALDRGSLGEVLLGFALGSGFIAALDLIVPHAHMRFRERGRPAAEELAARHRATLLLSALTIHNLPEGLAVGVAFAAGGSDLGLPLAIAIGFQNVPEGFAAAAPLLPVGSSPGAAAGVAALTGVVEPPAALAAYATFELAGEVLAGALAFAAGAMLYVVVDELVPESHGHGHERAASLALLGGFALMMGLDNAFGWVEQDEPVGALLRSVSEVSVEYTQQAWQAWQNARAIEQEWADEWQPRNTGPRSGSGFARLGDRSAARAAPVDAARERGGRDRPLAETPPALLVRIDRLLDQAAAAHAESSELERWLAFVPALLQANQTASR